MSCNGPKKTRIVIAGGGFAGLYAAKYFDNHLARRSDIEERRLYLDAYRAPTVYELRRRFYF